MEDEDTSTEMLIYGFGSDGMVSVSKDLIKIVGTNSEAYVQEYSEYDSKLVFPIFLVNYFLPSLSR